MIPDQNLVFEKMKSFSAEEHLFGTVRYESQPLHLAEKRMIIFVVKNQKEQ